jgi:uncharacterized iron-regulated membrane protein
VVNLDKVRSQVEEQLPGWRVIRFYFPDHPNEFTYLRLRSITSNRIRHIYVNQYTGQVLGSTEDGSNWIIEVHDLQVNFMSGKLGNAVVTIACYNLAALPITGVVIWWPRKTFWPRGGRSPVATTRDVHASIGFGSFAVLLLFIYQRFPEDKTPAGRSFMTTDPHNGAVLKVGSSRAAPLLETALVEWTREIHTVSACYCH